MSDLPLSPPGRLQARRVTVDVRSWPSTQNSLFSPRLVSSVPHHWPPEWQMAEKTLDSTLML